MKAMPRLGCCFAILAAVACGLVALAGSIDGASAKSGREGRGREGQANAPGAPMLAIVSLSDQRVSIYDGDGRRILQSPVSTGQTGLETPAGIFSIVQKKEVHQSNVYEDGNMPFMQRITWTGIALHAGVLPGQPASHGCVRMPHAFAQSLFGLTDIGLRVIIVRDDIAPAVQARSAPPGVGVGHAASERQATGCAAGYRRGPDRRGGRSWLPPIFPAFESDGRCKVYAGKRGNEEGERGQAVGNAQGG
jgi:L,D-transpeptidase catalytic domain